MLSTPLGSGWQLKQRTPEVPLTADFASSEGWITATVPGSTHEALLAAGLIPDPFLGTNELEVQWVGERDWLYRCTFQAPPALLAEPQIDLCFDGLDTFATVTLNGETLFSSDNMFVPQRASIVGRLREGENAIDIVFESALRHGREREAANGSLTLWNGDSSRLYVRKAPYHYGWDWGPTLLTSGPWREVRIEAYTTRISDLHAPAAVAPDLANATIPVFLITTGNAEGVSAQIELFDPTGALLDTVLVPIIDQQAQHTFSVQQPHLWWPHSHGAQPRYQLVATLFATAADGSVPGSRPLTPNLYARSLALGLRRIQLVQEQVAGETGSSFYFEINNVALFVGGANWIPDDIPTTRITSERYHAQVARAVAANMTMLRVWGGGIYEDAAFYEACDVQGILVWQDFLFACGMYPAADWFQQRVRAEAEAQVRRLRHYACIALWCGNNEDYSIAASRYQPLQTPEQNSDFPARMIYERLLPAVCATLDGTRPYWPGSPYGGSWSDDPTVGDTHVWSVWHQDMHPYQRYPQLAGRFVSEFGMAAFSALATVASFAPGETSPASPVIQFHQKAQAGHERMTHYMRENLAVPSDLPSFIYLSQLNQAEALTYAFSGWRRRWGTAGRRATGGALVWQLNDDWPTMSWAVIDYGLRPKAAYYAIKRALAPLAVGIECEGEHAGVWVVNSTLTPVEAQLELTVWALDGTALFQQATSLMLAANSVCEITLPAQLTGDQVIAARLLVADAVVARFTAWPQPLKALPLADPAITIEAADADAIRVSVTRPAKGVWLDAGDNVTWSDNGFDLLPGDPQIVSAPGLGAAQVTATSLVNVV